MSKKIFRIPTKVRPQRFREYILRALMRFQANKKQVNKPKKKEAYNV